MLGRTALWRHVVVAVVVIACSVLAFTGKIGEASRPEGFDAKQVVVQPAGADGLQIRETVDEDFGTQDRHGYERIIPNNFGVPTDISASSPDANADVSVAQVSAGTRIRLGDPSSSVSGRHRYVLTYTLPDAQISAGKLALNIINPGETLATKRFEIAVTGMVLDNPTCNVGSFGTVGGCTLTNDGAVYRTTISPLKTGQGITIGGTIPRLSTIEDIAAPAPPAPLSNHRMLLGLVILPIGLLSALGVFVVQRRKGRNEVFAGGAATAAFGVGAAERRSSQAAMAAQLPDVLPPEVPLPPPTAPTVLVADSKMAALATTEFAPPRGITPWQGAVLLDERLSDDTVASWFGGLAGAEVITLQQGDGGLVISRGPKFSTAPAGDHMLLSQLFAGGDTVQLGRYDAGFAGTWRAIRNYQTEVIQGSGWWRRPPGKGRSAGSFNAASIVIALVFLSFWIGSGVIALLGVLRSPVLAIALAVVAPAITAYFVYAFLLPARTATGSALALRTESFRRFLAASEGKHVDWAWKHGLLREYSGWAVALGAADAWSNALRLSGVPPTDSAYMYSPLLIHSMRSDMSSSIHVPQSSGSGGSGGGFSGGFSGGSVGGGGGGGSSGSW